jgi:hypothetical protein
MLAELFHYALTSCSDDARRFGHLGDAIALWAREGRCRESWAPHYARCHEAVARSIEGLPRRRTVLVLGSGLVRDVDMEALADAFDTVLLVDIVHLLPVRLRFAFRRKARWATADLSGAHAYLRGGEAVLTRPLAAWSRMPEIDLVISANVLSQLPLAPLERAALPGRHPRPAWAGLGRAIVENHLRELREFRCRVCLLSDTARTRRSRFGSLAERRELLFGADLPPPPLGWDWTVAPFGEEADGGEVVHHCRAYPDFLAAS